MGTISNTIKKQVEGIHYEQVYKVVLKDIPIFNKVSMKFMFQVVKPGQAPNTLIFAKIDEIFTLNFVT